MLQRTAMAVSIHCRCTPGTSGAVGGGSLIRAHFSLGAPLGHRCLLILHTGIHPERSAQQSAHTDTKWWSWDSSRDSNPAACTNPSGPGWVLLPGAMKGKAHTHCPGLRMRTTWGACWQLELAPVLVTAPVTAFPRHLVHLSLILSSAGALLGLKAHLLPLQY